MESEKQHEFRELNDEINIILSYKDTISEEEIHNFVNKFSSLSEYDIRKKIKDITGNDDYIHKFKNKVVNGEKREHETKKIEEQKDNLQVIRKNDSERVTKQQTIENKFKGYMNGEENITFDLNNIPGVSFIKAEVKYGQLSLEWRWPKGINKIMLCYKMDDFPLSSKDYSACRILIEKKDNAFTGDYIVDNAPEGDYYFSIYTLVECEKKMVFSKAQRRLVVNKPPQEILYNIKIKRSILGKLKTAELILSTDKEKMNLPPLVLVGKLGNMPLQRSQGKTLLVTDYETLTRNKSLAFQIPVHSIIKNMYVKLFFVEDVNSKMYRIISPAKEKLHFK